MIYPVSARTYCTNKYMYVLLHFLQCVIHFFVQNNRLSAQFMLLLIVSS